MRFSRGVFLNPMGTKLYLSLAHTEATCDEFCETFAAAFDAVRKTSEAIHAISS